MTPAIRANIVASNIATMNACNTARMAAANAAKASRKYESDENEFMFESRRRANELWLWAFGGFIGVLMCFLVYLTIGLFYN